VVVLASMYQADKSALGVIDEDINTSATIIPFIVILGPIT
jgi:hypothetical protein